MDLSPLYLKNANPTPLLLRNTLPDKPTACNFRKTLSLPLHTARIFRITDSSRNIHVSKHRSISVRAIGKKNHDDSSSSSSGNNDDSNAEDGTKQEDASVEEKKYKEEASQTPNTKTLDWREFRASLFSREQVEAVRLGSSEQDGNYHQSKPLGLKWAHPISSPETGCVLVATEKLDGVRTFERTVVLLLRSGTRHAQEGPFGVIINRPLHKKIRHMKPSNLDLATTFADCSLNFGGPLEASMFLSKTGEKTKLAGFEEVIPGLCFGARNSLDEAAGLVKKGVFKPQDFKFFVGYAGWQLDQLKEEIESDYWYMAACSADMIFGAAQSSSPETLWEEILQLMGGHYSELSRKPKQDM